MDEKQKNIVIITMLITTLFNFMAMLQHHEITKVTTFVILILSIYSSIFIGLCVLATYMFIQEKRTKLVVGGVITTATFLLCDLALITLFEIQIIKLLAIILFVIDVFYFVIMLNKPKQKK